MTQSKILTFLFSVFFFSFSTLLFAQKKTFVLKGGGDLFYGLEGLFEPLWQFGVSDERDDRSLYKFSLGAEVLVNHDVSIGVNFGALIPKNQTYTSSGLVGFSESMSTEGGYMITLEPFNYNFSQELKGLYMSIQGLLFLTSQRLTINNYKLPSRVLFNTETYNNNKSILAGGLKFGYKVPLNEKIGLDFGSGIYLSEDDPFFNFGINFLYFLK